MKTSWRKIVFKCFAFAAIFAAIWMLVSSVLEYDWNQSEYMGFRYEELEETETPDVLFVGASTPFADIAPAVIWNESGITSYNLGTSNNTSMTLYYQLKYVLKQHVPSTIVIDVSGLSHEKDLNENEAKYESLYRKMAATIPDYKIKHELIQKTCEIYPSQDPLTYYFPLLRYHQRWDNLQPVDFNPDILRKEYQSFRKGCHLNNKIMHMSWPDDPFAYNSKPVALYVKYFKKILSMCEDKGIQIVLVMYPRPFMFYSDYTAGKEISDKYDLPFVCFTTEESIKETGLDLNTDYYDRKHLNILGQEKFSRYFAHYLMDNYSYKKHDHDKALVKEWDKAYRDYMTYYKENTKNMPIVEE